MNVVQSSPFGALQVPVMPFTLLHGCVPKILLQMTGVNIFIGISDPGSLDGLVSVEDACSVPSAATGFDILGPNSRMFAVLHGALWI